MLKSMTMETRMIDGVITSSRSCTNNDQQDKIDNLQLQTSLLPKDAHSISLSTTSKN
jgi:hypothetical protein